MAAATRSTEEITFMADKGLLSLQQATTKPSYYELAQRRSAHFYSACGLRAIYMRESTPLKVATRPECTSPSAQQQGIGSSRV
jgi:hypothetical protein